jgi:hypothetical protein
MACLPISSALAGGLELPHEIVTERISDGGLMMIADEERLDPTNPEHLRRALRSLPRTCIQKILTNSCPKLNSITQSDVGIFPMFGEIALWI